MTPEVMLNYLPIQHSQQCVLHPPHWFDKVGGAACVVSRARACSLLVWEGSGATPHLMAEDTGATEECTSRWGQKHDGESHSRQETDWRLTVLLLAGGWDTLPALSTSVGNLCALDLPRICSKDFFWQIFQIWRGEYQ